MATIGNLGKTIVFSTSDQKILNFNDLSQTVSGRWAIHDRILKKPQSEFLGSDLRKITFKITLSALHGVKPRKTMEAIEKMVENGNTEPFVIGGKKVGKNQWKMTSISETWDTVMSKGELLKATLSITLEEYL
jgi:phage protein U